ncbi:polysaccharide biosynthesis/export family protein [Lysobacter sp. A6]|uniref:Polysaccharide biosynthesis/export family protein n=1 Tax=Noviluteimonas lactosilytica TaxID=2888523 RepID=A0ABS8JJ04_9GAMM|nr:polysaccharide biosynthesis/export family protein [Lysobacter lactosilyticus]MCC8363593.1 polysaccharide biosynthesis/export family protein [Lysobacter lactosilyticus]
MNTHLTRVIALATALVLTGCIPGQKMSVKGGGTEVVGGIEIPVQTITADMVSAKRQPVVLPAELTSFQPESYVVSPGDTLIITVWDHPELTTPAGSQQQAVTNGRQVQSDGTLFYPYAGKMKVGGMTVEQVRSQLANKLSRYLKEPQVDVNVVGFGGRVALQGAFTNTAPQDTTTVPQTLAQVVGRAGVDVANADISGLVLTRDGRNYIIDLDAINRDGVAQDIYLKTGDRLFMPYNDRKEVYVVGEANEPQAIPFKTTDMSLTQALGRAGGLDPSTSKGSAVYVIRGMDDQGNPASVYNLDATSPAAFAVASRFNLRAGDVVWIGPAGITRWNRYITQLLPFSGLIRNAAAAGSDL